MAMLQGFERCQFAGDRAAAITDEISRDQTAKCGAKTHEGRHLIHLLSPYENVEERTSSLRNVRIRPSV